MLLLGMLLNFLIPTSLQSSASATITSGCLPMWNLKRKTQPPLVKPKWTHIYPDSGLPLLRRRAASSPVDWPVFLCQHAEQARPVLDEQRQVSDERERDRSGDPAHAP